MPISQTRLAEMKASAEQGNSASAEDTLLLLAEIERMAAREQGAGGTGMAIRKASTARLNGAGGAKRIGPIGDPTLPTTTIGLAPDGTAYVTGGYGARGNGA